MAGRATLTAGTWPKRQQPGQQPQRSGARHVLPCVLGSVSVTPTEYHEYPPMFRVGTVPSPADISTGPSGQERFNGREYNSDCHMDYCMSKVEKALSDMADTHSLVTNADGLSG